MSKTKKPFCERSRAQQLWLLALAAVSIALVTAAERDIRRRPREEVRGGKLPWRVVSLNALGAMGYLCWGRRRAS